VQRHPGPRPHGGDDPKSPEAPAPVILITYATTEDAVRRALKTIRRTGVIAGKPQVIRIEKS
jgi:homoserine dehydrogenase